MIDRIAPKSALRPLGDTETPRVTTVELFFDLVYVFSIIQLSHYLLAHLSWLGAIEFATVFAGVWWAWNYTAWAANWLDPDTPAGRVLMMVLMACALLMAVAIPTAFSTSAGLFVGAYVTMAVVRAAYMALLFRGRTMGRNYGQLLVWSLVSGGLWIAGAVLDEARLPLWIAAVVLDVGAPSVGFWVPGLGSTPMTSWPLRALHLLERNQLVFIIALGESILLLGGTLLDTPVGAGYLLAGAVGFLIIVSIWALYFVGLAERAEAAFERADDPTQLARAGLAYSHGVMVCGAIVVAVGIEIIIVHPFDPVDVPQLLVAAGGPVLFLLASGVYERSVTDRFPPWNLPAAAALALVGWAAGATGANGLMLGIGIALVLLLTNLLPHRAESSEAPAEASA